MNSHRRSGFTLVEMMVAMTLTIFVMVILSECFIQGLETFSGLKVIGDMQEQLRTATTLLRSDLSQDHFEGKRRLSEPVANFTAPTIREGFFVIGQGYPNQASMKNTIGQGLEAPPQALIPPPPPPPPDPDGIGSYHVTDHWLHFSVRSNGTSRQNFFSAVDHSPGGPKSQPLGTVAFTFVNNPNANNTNLANDSVFQTGVASNVYYSPWAEIAYFLVQTGTTVNPLVPGGGGTQLFALYRCQFLVFPNTTVDNTFPVGKGNGTVFAPNNTPSNQAGNMDITNFSGFSCTLDTSVPATPKIFFFNPGNLAQGYTKRCFNPYQTFKAGPPTPGVPPPGSTLILSNVVSFQVEALITGGTDFQDLGLTGTQVKGGPCPIPFDTANYVNGPALPIPPYPSAVTPGSPNVSIQGIQIILRIWDPKSQVTRQVTLLQDM